jgi:hypothetical protein
VLEQPEMQSPEKIDNFFEDKLTCGKSSFQYRHITSIQTPAQTFVVSWIPSFSGTLKQILHNNWRLMRQEELKTVG